MKLYLIVFIVLQARLSLMALQHPVPQRPIASFQALQARDIEDIIRIENQQRNERAEKLNELLTSDENYAKRLHNAIKDTVAYITKYQLCLSRYQMNNPDLEESIELYLENQYPNFSLSEYEYVWTQSKNQLSELISELSKKQKNKPINRPKPLQLTPCKTCKSKML